MLHLTGNNKWLFKPRAPGIWLLDPSTWVKYVGDVPHALKELNLPIFSLTE
jgi:hypothetical protein